MPIITTTDTEASNQARSLVSIAFDSINLPDSTLTQDVFLGDANLEIQERIPHWETLTDDKLKYLRIITIKQWAINILVAFSRYKSESHEGISIGRDHLTPLQAIARYENDILDGIEILNPESVNVGGRYIVAAVIV